jgi:hypothetical protein
MVKIIKSFYFNLFNLINNSINILFFMSQANASIFCFIK